MHDRPGNHCRDALSRELSNRTRQPKSGPAGHQITLRYQHKARDPFDDQRMMYRSPLKYSKRCAPAMSRFRMARSGATAAEFALIAPVFLALLIAILQVGIVFFAEQALQSAAVIASRLVLTGQAQSSSMTQAQFLNAICPRVQTLFTCSNIMVDVQNYTSFSASNYSTPTLTYDAGGNVTNQWSFSPGAAGSIVV